MKLICIILCLFVISIQASSQQFLNGSFEQNRLNDCDSFNLTNSVYNSLMDSVYGIGTLPGLDLMVDSCTLYQTIYEPKDGHYFSSLESGWDTINTTAISFLLSQPLITHNTYIISFYAKSVKNISQFYPIKLVIGYSNDNASFGAPVDTTDLPDTIWTKEFVRIRPEFDADYITIKGLPGTIQLFTIVDEFSFDTTGIFLTTLNLEKGAIDLYPNPCTDILRFQVHGLSKLNIYNCLGELVIETFSKNNNDIITIDVSNIPGGIYIMQGIINDRIISNKFIKQ